MHPISLLTALLLGLATLGFATLGCGISSNIDPNSQSERDIAYRQLDEFANSWAYGEGLGHTTLNISGAIIFPPYTLFVLTNALIQASGGQALGLSRVLDEDKRSTWERIYAGIVGVPGRLSAAIAGKEYRSGDFASKQAKILGGDLYSGTSADVIEY